MARPVLSMPPGWNWCDFTLPSVEVTAIAPAESPESTPSVGDRGFLPESQKIALADARTPPHRPAPPRSRPKREGREIPDRSAFRSEAVLRWRLREAQKQLQLTTEELNRTRSMLSALQRMGGQNHVVAGSEDEHFHRLLHTQEDLKSDLHRLASAALRRDDAAECALEMWTKWQLPWPPPGRSSSKATSAEPKAVNKDVRHRARRRWRRVALFVSFAFGSARRGAKTASRYLGFRVKELCEQFQEQFAGEAAGVYEAVMHHARRVEIERNVEALLRDKLQKKKRPDKLEKEDSLSFEEIEREMADRYNQAFEEAGGIDEVLQHVSEVNELVRKYHRGRIRQDAGVEVLGLKPLYDLNGFWMEKFNLEVQRIATYTHGVAQIPPLKGYSRARTKVLTRYGNDAACLTDVMRASVIYSSIEEAYSALHFLLREDGQNPRPDLAVVEVNDRFQSCRDGYRDISLLFDMSGVICELQLHIRGIIDAKKTGGHKAYRVQREVNELIFEAAVQNSAQDLSNLMKAYDIRRHGTRDKNGRSSLHYAAQHGSLSSARILLASGSDPWGADDSGVLPLEVALKGKHFEAACMLLASMLQQEPASRGCLARLAQQIVPWWCGNIVSLPFAAPDLIHWRDIGRLMMDVLRRYKAINLLDDVLTAQAKRGAAATLRALLAAGADQVLGSGKESLCDYALRTGQIDLVKMLVCMRLGDGTPVAAHCYKESVHSHLKMAAKSQDSAYAKAALAASADPRQMSARSVGKRTPLMCFAAAGDLEVVQALVESGAEVQWIDGYCCNAIHYAQSMKRSDVVEYLRSVRVVTEVPLKHTSAQDVVQYLLKAVQDGCCGAVQRASTCIRTMQAMAQAGDDAPQLRDVLRSRFGFELSLLHFAVKVVANVDPAGQVCRALLMAKADPRLASAVGDTPLHFAASDGCSEIYDELARATLKLEAEDAVRGRLVGGAGAAEEAGSAELLAETQKILRRRLVRQEVESEDWRRSADEDTSKWLQAGLLAFKHAVLQQKLRRERDEGRPPSPKKSAKRRNSRRASVAGPVAGQISQGAGGRRTSGAGLPRPSSGEGRRGHSPSRRRSSVMSPPAPASPAGSAKDSPRTLQRMRRMSLG
ncbi:Ankrd17 [Symbiodinium natans]|uniref:Ankrd17 protein n=1 Tax=Symbiodinium natans TaxID=878477 RepID=A0A812TM07_9DINO|nr:Ankrd17 [Symbiodinium natans]